ncbi:MAG: RdgB/HAM1 family non-canonical purine NTP pyrophosphatase [Candidatus Pacebacteria bacterium]|nr:RdgB/HAM1 family non-canonical purine NTP pyrophosphatase [Candidatus Paceibacterota bacterium]
MHKYNFKKIEKKWQKEWEESGIYEAKDFSKKEKFYCLIEFPYPSGAGLHIGHVRSQVAMDVVCRKKRMQGKNVLYPIGWDAFGLPTENFAIKTKKQPATVTRENIANYTRQAKSYGPSFDWSREINTTDPNYFKWTQWIFLKLYNSFYDEKADKARPIEELIIPKGLDEIEKKNFIDENRIAYEKEMPINWCPSCKIGLANEEVIGGNCERCGALAEKKNVRQWMLRITKYSERLINDLDTVDYLEKIKTQQVNWIGKSQGAEIDFPVKISGEKESAEKLRVFTTRPDTIFGVSYMVVAPEHPIIEKYKSTISNWEEVQKYIEDAKNKSDMDRTDLSKDKTGIELQGIKAINPASGEEIPIWTSDYVLIGYGTGAIMAVPAHDTRDMEFAIKFNLEIKSVIEPEGGRTAIFVHGFEDDKNGQYSPWKDGDLRKKLEALGYEIIAPNMPDSHHPKRAEWISFLKQYESKINANTIFIGHSLGCAAVADFINEIDKKVKGVYLIAPASEVVDFVEFKKEWRNDNSDVTSVEAFAKDKTDWKSLKGKAEIIKVFISDDDKYIPFKETLRYFEERKINCISLHEQKHFIGRRIPELYKEIAQDSYVEHGVAINSHEYSGLSTEEFKKKIVTYIEKNKLGKRSVNYKLRDWVFSRQHYWGEPIPIIKCKHCLVDKLDIKVELNFPKEEVFRLIKNGSKTIETRALNPEEPERSFGKVKVGDLVKFKDKQNNDFEIAKITKVYKFESLRELFEDKGILGKIFPDFKDSHDYKKLEKEYSFTTNYLEKIENNGLVAWEFELLNITKKIPLREKDLPLKLPDVKNYEPTDTGESPLAGISTWVEVKCPICGNSAKRETDTMPNWAGSSWYFLRYIDVTNDKAFADRKKLDYWMPVDLYNGGMEHTTLHLLYSRFWHKFLYDLGFVGTAEPYKSRRSHGMIIAEDGQKMSKSRGNVVNPDDIIATYGADTLRVYEMFMGPYSEAIAWNTNSLIGVNRFLERVWNLQNKVKEDTGKTKLLLASNNPGKLRELKSSLKGFDIIGLEDLETKFPEPKETGKSFEENSLLKAKYYAKKTGYLTIADDSGLCIKAMDNQPGVYSNRFAKGDYPIAYEKIFKELEGKDRSAFFESVITLYNAKTDKTRQFDGICEGRIADKPTGTNGFGYDPIFIAQELNKTFGECVWEEKAKYDHRAKAVNKLKAYLDDNNKNNEVEPLIHKTIKKITEDINDLKFNTCISQLMILANALEKQEEISKKHFEIFITLLCPFAPHIAEEIWVNLENKKSIHLNTWPVFDPKLIHDKEIELVIQVSGKVRDKIKVSADISEEEARSVALSSEKVIRWLEGKTPRKVIVVKGKLVSIVI